MIPGCAVQLICWRLRQRVLIQRDPDRLETWAAGNHINKCRVFYLRQSNPMQQDRSGTERLESNFAEVDLSVLVGKLNTSQQRISMAEVTNCVLGCTSKCITSEGGRWFLPSAPVRPHLECCGHFWASYCRRSWHTGVSPSETAEMAGDWSTWHIRRGSENGVCLVHRRGG